MDHSSRKGSIVGGSRLYRLSPMDEAVIRLNSHRLVQPGMTMEQVQALLVFRDELLDAPPPPELDTLGMVWRASISLTDAETVRFKVRGGWRTGGCNFTFGVRRGRATLALGGVDSFLGFPDIAYFADHDLRFFQIWSNASGEWRWHRWREKAGTWESVEGQEIDDSTYWWAWNDRLHRTLRSLLNDSAGGSITIADRSNGTVTLRATLDHSYPTLQEWEDSERQDTIDFLLVLDDETYEIEGYTWRKRYGGTRGCRSYEEEAIEGELGIDLEIPEVIRSVLER